MWRPTSSSRRNPKAESSSRPPLSPRSTLTEVLRLNQLRVKNSSPALTKENAVQDAAISLNEDLAVLAGIYPDVKYDCLRELLSRFDGDSRLEICTEQLYRYKNEWVKGRLQVPPREQDEQIHTEEQFRTQQYRSACSWLLQKEFNSLNKSAIEAVLAEVNNAYGKARPILQEIANKSWRATLQSLFRKKKDTQSLPTFLWTRGRIGQELVPTGDIELDNELEALFVRPLRTELAQSQQEQDFTLAVQLNEWEAQQAEALYECQICYSDTPFENVSACNTEGHIVCLDCVRKSLKEAIFGQNWAQSVEPALSTLKCLAPIDPHCNGHVPAAQLEQAVLLEHSGRELWDKFEERLAEKAIFDSQLPIVRCPFCPYIEADNFFTLETAHQHIQWSFQPFSRHRKILAILACEFILPTLLFVYLALRLVWPSLLPTLFYTSLARLASTQRTIRFQCQNPTCKRRSCLKCHKAWHDAHSCDEPLLLSLRQSVEAARTNAVKRVCPRCGTAFVKSSGCNKLTCVCGYSMCYLCRKNIGKTGENEGAEGYRHFCEHFRPVPGTKCTQCDKCDLYKSEEEDVIVRKAGEDAEREWRNKQKQEAKGGNSNEVDNLRINHDLLAERLSIWQKFMRGDWTFQGIADEIVAKVVIVQV